MDPLDPRWLSLIDAVAHERLGSSDRLGPALAEAVRALSQIYTRRAGKLRDQESALAARLRFWCPRDLPKVQGPLHELERLGALPAGPTWRVLDLGGGLGATGLGVADFARRRGVEALRLRVFERDATATALYVALARAGEAAGLVPPIELRTGTADIEQLPPEAIAERFDLVLVGLALNELFASARDPIERRAAWLGRMGRLLAPGGHLVVLEPALKETCRALQAVRDRIAAGEVRGLTVRAPCTHLGPCPMLLDGRNWCHEQANLPLPEPLAEIARAAGLRWERLTWSNLVLAAEAAPRGGLRVVGGPIESKGQVEWDLCGPGGLTRLARQKRHQGPDDVCAGLGRGDELEIPGELGTRVRADKVEIRRLR